MMFSRQATRAFQAAQPMRQSIRRYATEQPSSGGSSKTVPILAGLGAVGAAGYYFTQRDPGAAAKAEAGLKQAAGVEAKKAFIGGDQGFLSLKLEEVENVNHNSKRFRFKLPEDDQVSGMPVTSALLTKFKAEGAQKATLRPYTPISDTDTPGYIDLLIKKYPDGPMSTHIHNMVPGQRLEIKGPLPKYPWEENKHEHIGLIAGGTGITPMYQLAQHIFRNPNDKTKVTLVFGNISEEDILLRKEFAELENKYPQRFRAFYVLDNPPKAWAGNSGYITKDLIKTVMPEPKSGNIKLFVCGPPGLMNAVSGNKVSPKDQGELSGALKELGYDKDQVYKF